MNEEDAVLVIPEAGSEAGSREKMIFLVVVQVLVEILPQFNGDGFWVVFRDVLMIDHLQCATFRVVFVVKMIDSFRHLLIGSATIG